MIRFLQVNLNGNWGAQQLLHQTTVQNDTDIIIVSEPFTKCDGGNRMCFSTDRKAAVGTTPGAAFIHDDKGSGTGFAWMKFGGLTVFSCYCRPGCTLGEYTDFLGNLEDAIRDKQDTNLIVSGDFNA